MSGVIHLASVFFAKIITKMFCDLKRFYIFAMSKRDKKQSKTKNNLKINTL